MCHKILNIVNFLLSIFTDDIKRKKVRQEQSKYKEIMDRYHKKEPFKAFNVNDDDEEFSDSVINKKIVILKCLLTF